MLKRELAAHCLIILDEKIASIQGDLDELLHSKQGESKSSAGDKHETARAMMNMEQDKLGRLLKETLTLKEKLLQIDFTKSSKEISAGSLITTNKGVFLLSVSLGKVKLSSSEYFLLSGQSPLGEKLMGRSEGDTVILGNTDYIIQRVT